MNRLSVKTLVEVRRIIVAVLEIKEPSSKELSCATLPMWDSLKNLEIFFAIEDGFGIEFDENEFASLDSCEKIAAAIDKKIPPDAP